MTTQFVADTGMSSPIPFAVVGLGYGAHWLEHTQTHPGREQLALVAVCDQHVERAHQIGARWGVPALAEFDQVVADPTIRLIALFTRPAGRAGLIARCLQAGKDVLTTKPLELDPDAALAVLRQAQTLGRIVHLNSPAPVCPPDLALIGEWEWRFDLGRPIAAQTAAWHGGAITEVAEGSWYDDPALCPLAPMLRIGIYGLNDLVRVWGEADVVEVFATRRVTGRPTPDTALASLRFANGALGSVFASLAIGDGDGQENRMSLHYERGTIYRNVGPRPAGPERAVLRLAARQPGGVPIDAQAEVAYPSGSYDLVSLVRALRGEALADVLTPEASVAGLRLLAALTHTERRA